MTWTTPRTWVPGEKPPASTLNTHIRDNFKAIGDPWATFTPTWTATTNPAIGNGTIAGRYINAGKLVIFEIEITMGSTTTFGTGGWSLSLPVASRTTKRVAFDGTVYDSSAAQIYPLSGVISGASLMDLKVDSLTAGAAFRNATSANPFTWATADELVLTGVYEAA